MPTRSTRSSPSWTSFCLRSCGPVGQPPDLLSGGLRKTALATGCDEVELSERVRAVCDVVCHHVDELPTVPPGDERDRIEEVHSGAEPLLYRHHEDKSRLAIAHPPVRRPDGCHGGAGSRDAGPQQFGIHSPNHLVDRSALISRRTTLRSIPSSRSRARDRIPSCSSAAARAAARRSRGGSLCVDMSTRMNRSRTASQTDGIPCG